MDELINEFSKLNITNLNINNIENIDDIIDQFKNLDISDDRQKMLKQLVERLQCYSSCKLEFNEYYSKDFNCIDFY